MCTVASRVNCDVGNDREERKYVSRILVNACTDAVEGGCCDFAVHIAVATVVVSS